MMKNLCSCDYYHKCACYKSIMVKNKTHGLISTNLPTDSSFSMDFSKYGFKNPQKWISGWFFNFL